MSSRFRYVYILIALCIFIFIFFFSFFFFFFKQKTAYEMRISDWSSDVCSSDLLADHLGEMQLTDALAKMIGEGPFHGLRFDGERYDCGDKIGFRSEERR